MTSVDNHTEVKSKFPAFQETLGKFLEAQDEYQEILSNIEEAERSEEYGEEVENTSPNFKYRWKMAWSNSCNTRKQHRTGRGKFWQTNTRFYAMHG